MRLKLKLSQAWNINHAYLLFFVALLPTCLFVNNELIWDDQFIMKVHAAWSVKALLGAYGINSGSYWRPVTVLLIAVPYLLGLSVAMCKFISVALYFIQGCLALSILSFFLRERTAAEQSLPLMVLAATLALHPVFVETTLWISARADLLLGTFVLVGVLWIARLVDQQRRLVQPESAWLGLLRGFVLTWLASGSKDSGIVWAGLVFVTVVYLQLNSPAEWKKYWRLIASGIAIGAVSYLTLRMVILGAVFEPTQIAARNASTMLVRLQFFTEFMWRSVLAIFLPVFDMAPFKSAGWFASESAVPMLALVLAILAIAGLALRGLYNRNITCAWLSLCALMAILFHATIETFVEPTSGSVLASRYLGPSAILIFLSLATILLKRAEGVGNLRVIVLKLNIPVMLVFVVMLIQSIWGWGQARESWRSNLGLWKNSWQHESSVQIVASNYSIELFTAKKFAESLSISQNWLDAHKADESTPRLCAFYDIQLKDYLNLQDQAHAADVARRALPVAWCYSSLAQNVAFIMMQEHCPEVLSMVSRAVTEADKPPGVGAWRFASQEDKIALLAVNAYAEARCGKNERALSLLQKLANLNSQWTPSGPMAQSLLDAAHKDGAARQ